MSQAGWVRIDVIKTRLISILMRAKMQLLEVVTGHSQFLSHFSIPQAIPTQPVTVGRLAKLDVLGSHTLPLPLLDSVDVAGEHASPAARYSAFER